MTDHAELFIPVLLGTGREGRASEKAARLVHEEIKKAGVASVLIDARDYAMAATHASWQPRPENKPWQEAMAKADGLIIVAPEYNHGYPGELKIVLDSLYKEYARKPVAICGVSSGPFGGTRLVEQLRQVVIEFSMVPLRNVVYFSNIVQTFNDDGSLKDGAVRERLKPMFEELFWYARALKAARASS